MTTKTPIIKAIFLTRCGCSAETIVPYPPSPKMYRPLKRTVKWYMQDELSNMPSAEIRSFTMTQYGYLDEPDRDVVHVLYEEDTP